MRLSTFFGNTRGARTTPANETLSFRVKSLENLGRGRLQKHREEAEEAGDAKYAVWHTSEIYQFSNISIVVSLRLAA